MRLIFRTHIHAFFIPEAVEAEQTSLEPIIAIVIESKRLLNLFTTHRLKPYAELERLLHRHLSWVPTFRVFYHLLVFHSSASHVDPVTVASLSHSTMKGLFVFVSVAISAASVNARTFTVKNNCAFTIWPGLFTDPNVGPARPDQATGWEAPAGSSVQFNVPNDWKAGRIWGRTSCDFSTNPGPTSCVTGGCNGGLECAAQAGTGVPPASLAEWTLQGDGNRDFYDVSLVDGFNLPMAITNNVGCPVADCPVDLNANCPAEIRGPANGDGSNAGCKSACLANLDGNQADSANCCSGSHNTPATCPADGVQFYHYFKDACPNSYAYAYDESSNTALWTCDSGLNADYTLTFCP